MMYCINTSAHSFQGMMSPEQVGLPTLTNIMSTAHRRPIYSRRSFMKASFPSSPRSVMSGADDVLSHPEWICVAWPYQGPQGLRPMKRARPSPGQAFPGLSTDADNVCRDVSPSSLLLEDQETVSLWRELLPRLVDREPASSLSVLSVKVRVSFRSKAASSSSTYTCAYVPPATVHTLAHTGGHILHTHIHTYTQSLEFRI